MKRQLVRLLFLPLTVLPAVAAAADITLFALFKDKAILHVDGTRRVLAIGTDSPEGVKLVSTDTQAEEAVVELNLAEMRNQATLNTGARLLQPSLLEFLR